MDHKQQQTPARLDPRQSSIFGDAHEQEIQARTPSTPPIPCLSEEARAQLASVHRELERLYELLADGVDGPGASQITKKITVLKRERNRLQKPQE